MPPRSSAPGPAKPSIPRSRASSSTSVLDPRARRRWVRLGGVTALDPGRRPCRAPSTGRWRPWVTSPTSSSPCFARPLVRRRELARRGVGGCGLRRRSRSRRSDGGLVHDLGGSRSRRAVWQKAGPLTADEWEHVRLHAYHTERCSPRSRLATLGAARRGAPRAARRLAATTAEHRRRAARRRAAARRRRRLPHDDRAPAAPSRRSRRTRPPGRLGEEAEAGRLDARRRRSRARRPPGSGSATRAAGGADRARGGRSSVCSRAGSRPSRSPVASGSRRRQPTVTSRTPTPRSASRPGPRRRCSRWSTA